MPQVGSIIATNDGLPESPNPPLDALLWAFEIGVRTVVSCTREHRRTTFTRLRQGREQSRLEARAGGRGV